jgi:hypothetical protein
MKMIKRNRKTLLVTLLVFSFGLTSCNKEAEWGNYYNFTIDDIVGHYSPSSAEIYESNFSSSISGVYPDASVTVTKLGPTTLKVSLDIPSIYSKSFTGGFEQGSYYLQLYSHDRTESKNIDGKIVVIAHYGTSFTVDVLKGEDGQIRLHGMASYRKFSPTWTIEDAYNNYYFDVTKD